MEDELKRTPPVVVLWSGGFDSTLLVMKAIEAHRDIVAVSFNAEITGEVKNEREAATRQNLKYMLKRYLNHRRSTSDIQYVDVNIGAYNTDYSYSSCVSFVSTTNATIRPEDCPATSGRLTQSCCHPVFWLGNILPMLENDCEIWFGYIFGDDSITFKSQIEAAVNAYAQICDKDIAVKFPLQRFHKWDVLQEMKNYDEAFLDACVSCESSSMTERRCGQCQPCCSLQVALMHLSLYGPNSAFWQEMLKKWFGLELSPVTAERQDAVDTAIYACDDEEPGDISVGRRCGMCNELFTAGEVEQPMLCPACTEKLRKLCEVSSVSEEAIECLE